MGVDEVVIAGEEGGLGKGQGERVRVLLTPGMSSIPEQQPLLMLDSSSDDCGRRCAVVLRLAEWTAQTECPALLTSLAHT